MGHAIRAYHDKQNKKRPIIIVNGEGLGQLTYDEAMFMAIFMNAIPKGMQNEPVRSAVPVQKPKRT